MGIKFVRMQNKNVHAAKNRYTLTSLLFSLL